MPGHVHPFNPFQFNAPRPGPTVKVGGVTKDSTGAVLGFCVVDLFDTLTDQISQTIISDVVGSYVFDVDPNRQYYARVTSPDGLTEGTTLNTLTGSPTGDAPGAVPFTPARIAGC